MNKPSDTGIDNARLNNDLDRSESESSGDCE